MVMDHVLWRVRSNREVSSMNDPTLSYGLKTTSAWNIELWQGKEAAMIFDMTFSRGKL